MSLLPKWMRAGLPLLAVLGLMVVLTGCQTAPSAGDSVASQVAQLDDSSGRLRAEDMVSVAFSGAPNPPERYDGRVKADGNINLPLVGAIKAEGMSTSELEKAIQKAYVPRFFVNLSVNVNSENRFFHVVGEVNNRSRQVYSGRITVLGAIAAAGGFTDYAKKWSVQIIRTDGKIIKVDCDKAIKNPKLDIEIYPGDRIFVPRRIW